MYIHEITNFIRLKVCLYVTSLAVTGYLLSNPIDADLAYVAAATFTLTAAIYALNRKTDLNEDELNNRK